MDSDVELEGWVWRYSIVGKNDWKPQHWKKWYAKVSKSVLCFYKDEDEHHPCGMVNLAASTSLTVYSTQQDDFPFTDDGYNYFIGLQFYEENKDTPLLLLLKCVTQQDHQTWTHHFSTHMAAEPFNSVKRNFPTFEASILEKATRAETLPEASSSDDDEAREMIASYMSDKPAVQSAAPSMTSAQAQVEAAKKRLQKSRSRADERSTTATSSGLKEKLAALKAKNKEAAIPRPFLEPVAEEEASRRERTRSFIEDIPATPVLVQQAGEGTQTAARSKLEKVLAQQRSKSGDDIAKKLQSFAERLDKDVADDVVEEEGGEAEGSPATLVSSSTAVTSEKRAKLLAKAKQAKAKKMTEIAVQTESTGDIEEGSAELEEKLHDATARAQAAEAEVEAVVEQTTQEKEQLRLARQRCQSLIAERDGMAEKLEGNEKDSRDQIQKLKDKLSEMVEEREDMKKSLQEASQLRQELEGKLGSAEVMLSARGDEMGGLRQQFEDEQRDRETRIAALESELTSKTTKLEGLAQQLVDSNQSKAGASDELAELKRQLDEAEAASVAKLKEVQDTCGEQLQALQRQLDSALSDEATVRQQAEEASSAKDSELHELQTQVSATNMQLEAAQTEMSSLQEQGRSAQSEFETLTRELGASKDAATGLEARLNEKKEEVAKLSEGNDQAQVLSAKLDEVMKERDESRVDLQSLQQQISTIEDELKSKKAEQEAERTQREELEAKVSELETSISEVNIETSKAKRDLAKARNQSLQSLVDATGKGVNEVGSSAVDDSTKERLQREQQAIAEDAAECTTEEERAAISERVLALQKEVNELRPQLGTESQAVLAEAEMEAGIYNNDDVEGWKEVAKRLLREKSNLLRELKGWTCGDCSQVNDEELDTCPACAALKPQETEAEKAKRELVEKTEALDNVAADVSRLTAQLQSSEDERTTLQTGHEALQAEHAALLESSKSSEREGQAAEHLEAESSELREALQRAEQQLQEHTANTEKLQEQVDEQATVIEGLEENVAAGKEVARKLLQEKRALQEDLDATKDDLDKSVADMEQREDEERDAEKEATKKLMEEKDKLQEEMAALSQKATESTETERLRSDELDKLRQQLEVLQTTQTTEKQQAEEQQKLVEGLSQELEKAKEEVETLKASGDTEVTADLQVVLEKLKEENSALIESVAAKEAERVQATGRHDAAQTRPSDAESELQVLQEAATAGDDAEKEMARKLLQERNTLQEQLKATQEEADANLETSKEVLRKLLEEKKVLEEALDQAKTQAPDAEAISTLLEEKKALEEELTARQDGSDAAALLHEKSLLEEELKGAKAQLMGREDNPAVSAMLDEKKALEEDLQVAREQAEEAKALADKLREERMEGDVAGREVARKLLQERNALREELEEARRELQTKSSAKNQSQLEADSAAAMREATVKAAEATLANSDLSPEERAVLEEKLAAVREMSDDDAQLLAAEVAVLQETVEQLDHSADTVDAELHRSFFQDVTAQGSDTAMGDEEVWREVSRKLLVDKKGLETTLSGTESALEVAKGEMAAKEAECARLLERLAECERVDDEKAAHRLKEMELNMVNLNESINELEEALVKERKRGDHAAEELKNAVDTAEKERDTLLVKLAGETPDDQRAAAFQVGITRRLEEDEDLTEEERERLQQLANMSLSSDPEVLKQQLQELQTVTAEIGIDDSESETWKEVARRLLNEKRELQEALAQVQDREDAVELLPSEVKEQVSTLCQDADRQKAQQMQSSLQQLEQDPAFELLPPEEREEVSRVSNAELSADPETLHKQLEDIQSVVSSVRHSSIMSASSLQPELQREFESQESWKEVAKRLLQEKKEMQEALAAVNDSDAVAVLPEEVRDTVKRLTEESEEYVPQPSDQQKAEDLQDVLREALCTPAAGNLSPEDLERLQELANAEVNDENATQSLKELQHAAAILMDPEVSKDLPADLQQDLMQHAEHWKEVSRNLLRDKKSLEDELEDNKSKVAELEAQLVDHDKLVADLQAVKEQLCDSEQKLAEHESADAQQQKEVEELQATLTAASQSSAVEQLPEEHRQRLSRVASMVISEDPKLKQGQLEELQNVAVELMTSKAASEMSQEELGDFAQATEGWKEVARRLLQEKKDLSDTIEALQTKVNELEAEVSATEKANTELGSEVQQLKDSTSALERRASQMEEEAQQMSRRGSVTSVLTGGDIRQVASTIDILSAGPEGAKPESVQAADAQAEAAKSEADMVHLQQTLRSISSAVSGKLPESQLQELARVAEMEISKDPMQQQQQMADLQEAAVAVQNTDGHPELEEALQSTDAWKDVSRRLLQENNELKAQLERFQAAKDEERKTTMLEALLDAKESLPLRLKERIDHLSLHPEETSVEELAAIIDEVTTTPSNLTPEQVAALTAALQPEEDEAEALKQQVDDLLQALASIQDSAAASQLPEHLQQMLRDVKEGSPKRSRRTPILVPSGAVTPSGMPDDFKRLLNDILKDPSSQQLPKHLLAELHTLADPLRLTSEVQSLQEALSRCSSRYDPSGLAAVQPAVNPVQLVEQLQDLRAAVASVPPSEGGVPSEVRERCQSVLASISGAGEVDGPTGGQEITGDDLDASKARVQELESEMRELEVQLETAQQRAVVERLVPMISSVGWMQVPEAERREIERLLKSGTEDDIKAAVALASHVPQLKIDSNSDIATSVSELANQTSAPAKSLEADTLQQALAYVLTSPAAQQLSDVTRQQAVDLIERDASDPAVQAALKELANELLSSNLPLPSEVLSGLNGEHVATWKDIHKRYLNDKAISEKVIARSRAGSLNASGVRECEALQQAFCALLCSPAAELLSAEQKKTISQLVDTSSETTDIVKLRTTAAMVLTQPAASKLTPRERESLQFGQHNDLWKFIVKRMQNEKQALEAGNSVPPERVESKQLQEALAAWSVLPSSANSEYLELVEQLVMQGDAAPLDELRKSVALIKTSPSYEGEPKELDSSMKQAEAWKDVTAKIIEEKKDAEETLTRERANSKQETGQSINALRSSLSTILSVCGDQLPAQQRAEFAALLEDESNMHKTPQQLLYDLSVAGQSVIVEDDGLAKAVNKAPSDTWKDVARKVLEEKKELENEYESLRTQNNALKPAAALPSESGFSELSALLGEKQELEQKVANLQSAMGNGTQWYEVAMQLTQEKKELEAQLGNTPADETTARRHDLQQTLRRVVESPASRGLQETHKQHIQRLAREGSDIVTLSEAAVTVRSTPAVLNALPEDVQRRLRATGGSASPLRCKDRVNELEGSIQNLLGTIGDLEGELHTDQEYNAVVDIQDALLKASQSESLSPSVRQRLTELATMEIYSDPEALKEQLGVLQEMAREMSQVSALPQELREALGYLSESDGGVIQEQLAGLKRALEAASAVSAPFPERSAYDKALVAVAEQAELPDELRSYITGLTEGKHPTSPPPVDPMWRSERDSIADLEALLREKDRVIGGLEHELETCSSTVSPQQNSAIRKAAALRDSLGMVLESGAEISPALRLQIQALVSKNLGAMTPDELHAVAGSMRAVTDAVLTTGIMPMKVREALTKSNPAHSVAMPLPALSLPPLGTKSKVELSERQSTITGSGQVTTTGDSEIDYIEKMGGKVQSFESAVKSVLDSTAARYLPPTLHYQLSSLVKRPAGNFIQVVAGESDEEVVALRLRVAELEEKAMTLEGHAKRSDDMVQKLRDLSKIPGMPEESRREIHTAIASDAALMAASKASAVEPERVSDLEKEITELSDTLASVLECPAADQLPDSLRHRIHALVRSNQGQIPLTDHYKELQDVASAVQNTAVSDMFPEWLLRRLDRLIQENSNEKTEILLNTLGRLEAKVQRLEGSKGRVDNLLDSVKHLRTAEAASLPEEARRAMDTLIGADVAAAQRLLREAETTSAAALSASAGEAGASALAALLRNIEPKIGTVEGSAVQLAEASTAASGLCNAAGVVGSSMNAVASLTHDALSSMRGAEGLPAALSMVGEARRVAEAAAAASAAARFVSTALSMAAHTGKLGANDLNVFANRLYSETKDLPNECHSPILKLTKDLRQAALEGTCADVLTALARDASAIAGYEQVAARPRYQPSMESARELRTRAVEMRASGAPPMAAATVDKVAQMMETGDATTMWDVISDSVVPSGSEAAAPELTSWTGMDPSVAKVVRQALRHGSLPDDARSYLADTLEASQGRVGPLADAAESILGKNNLGEGRRWVEDLATAADMKARDLANGITSLLRSKVVSGEAAVILGNAVAEADQQLRTLMGLAQSALETPAGIPDEVAKSLSGTLAEASNCLKTTALVAMKDPGLSEQTRRVLHTTLQVGNGIEVALEAALSCSGLTRGVRRQVQETLASFRTPVPGLTRQPLLPSAHVTLPHAVRRAEMGSLPPASVSFSAALQSAKNRAVTLERAIDSVLRLSTIPEGVRGHLLHMAPVEPCDYDDNFEPTDVNELTLPSTREGLGAILKSTNQEDMTVALRQSLEGLAGLKQEDAQKGHPQVVVLENPGAGEWLDVDIEAELPGGRSKVRVLPLPSTHAAVRFSGKHLAVDSMHIRYKQEPVKKPTVGTRVRRNLKSWKWGEQDGGAGKMGVVTDISEAEWIGVQWIENGRRSRYRWGREGCYDVALVEQRPALGMGARVSSLDHLKQGTVIGAEDGWVTVKWDMGAHGRYRWGQDGEYDVKICTSEAPDEEGIRAAIRAAISGPEGDSLSDLARLRLESLVGPGSPHRKVTRDIQRMVDEIKGQPDAGEVMVVQQPPTSFPGHEWVVEAKELLLEVGGGLVEARGQQWVLFTPELAVRITEFNGRGVPAVDVGLPTVLKGLLSPEEPVGVNVMEALREVLDTRDLKLAEQIRSLALTSLPMQETQGAVVSVPDATLTPTVVGISVGVQATPVYRSKGVNVDLTESLHKKLNSEREKVKGLQVELVHTSHRRSRSVDREVSVDPDPEVARTLKDLTLLGKASPPDPNDAWVDQVVTSTKQDPSMQNFLPQNFGRDAAGGVRFGTRKIDLVAINEFAAVRIGGGYMLFSDFVKKFGDTENRKLVVNREPAPEPSALIRSGRDMVFVDNDVEEPQPMLSRGVGPAGDSRPSSPRPLRPARDEYVVEERPEWVGVQEGRAPTPRRYSVGGVLPERSRSKTPGRERRWESPGKRYMESLAVGSDPVQWMAKEAPSHSARDDDVILEQELEEEDVPTPAGSTPNDGSLDLLESRLQNILSTPVAASPPRTYFRDPKQTRTTSPSPFSDGPRYAYPTIGSTNRVSDTEGRKAFRLSKHPIYDDKHRTVDYSTYMNTRSPGTTGGSVRRGSSTRPPAHPY